MEMLQVLHLHFVCVGTVSQILNNSALPSTIALYQLHCLPVKQRIHFKIATLTYRALQSGLPSYLSSLINLNNPPRPLRSASLSLLHVPFTARAVGRKAFRFAAPTIWNSIPQNIRLLPSTATFKRSLKTHLKLFLKVWKLLNKYIWILLVRQSLLRRMISCKSKTCSRTRNIV